MSKPLASKNRILVSLALSTSVKIEPKLVTVPGVVVPGTKKVTSVTLVLSPAQLSGGHSSAGDSRAKLISRRCSRQGIRAGRRTRRDYWRGNFVVDDCYHRSFWTAQSCARARRI